MGTSIITILILLLIVTTFIAIKLSSLQKGNNSIIKLLKEHNQLLISQKGTKKEKYRKQVISSEHKKEGSNELKTFTAKEVTIRPKNGKKNRTYKHGAMEEETKNLRERNLRNH